MLQQFLQMYTIAIINKFLYTFNVCTLFMLNDIENVSVKVK